MSGFAIRAPYFIIVVCLVLAVVGGAAVMRMPVDMFPAMNIPVVVVATFYNGMPPEKVETSITSRFERFFTLAPSVEHIESRSLPGVSIIKIYFQPGANADAAVSTISNLAMANLRRLPPGTLPPVVLKFDASSLPVCLVSLKGEGLSETRLRDQAQYNVRNQLAGVAGASVPQPFGGRYRQIMVYADPLRLEAHQLSLMDLVRSLNSANLILPSGDLQVGGLDYNIYTNSQLDTIAEVNDLPVRVIDNAAVRISDVGEARDANQIQTNVVRLDGQRSVYLPVLKQGGDSNTIAVVDGVRDVLKKLLDVPEALKTRVVFDQSRFIKTSIQTLLHEGALGMLLTTVMILLFLGSMRATVAVLFSIPLSALATFLVLWMGGGTLNTMVLGGLALAFSRLIDNSVVVLENIYRHLEAGEPPAVAAEKGGREVTLPVLAATLTTAIVFFPVVFLYGVSKYLFMALASAVVISLFASYFVALTVVPLYCARFLKGHGEGEPGRFQAWFNAFFERFLRGYDRGAAAALNRPRLTLSVFGVAFAACLALFPLLGVAFFPRTDPGQFVINIKALPGTAIDVMEREVARVEQVVRELTPKSDLSILVSNIGVAPGFSSIYTSNSGMHTAFLQVGLTEGHKTGTFELMNRVRARLEDELPQMSYFFQTGSLVDAVLNLGLPAPIDVQVSGSNLAAAHATAIELRRKIGELPEVSDAFVPQDIDYPALRVDIDRTRAAKLGLNQQEVVYNIITALTSNMMIAPSYWVDPKTGYDYMLAVQYPERAVKDLEGFRAISIRSPGQPAPARLDAVSTVQRIKAPTEVDHYQLRRVVDVLVNTRHEDLGQTARQIDAMVAGHPLPKGVAVNLRGMVEGMRQSFRSFALGLLLALVLLYLVLVAQFRSFTEPFLILLAVPPGLAGVLLTLYFTGTTLNVLSLMGVVMLAGIAVSNSILIVEFTHRLREDGMGVREAAALAARVRLRPVLMTSLATLLGMLPMALKLGEGSEAFAPLARAILGGLAVSVALTVFLVPAAYTLARRKEEVEA